MKIGFTGTQAGVTDYQFDAIATALRSLQTHGFTEFHNGDCVGADATASVIAGSLGYTIILHPPLNESKRAWSKCDYSRPAKEYLDRNHDIVDESDFMIATPYNNDEELRSGTWATIRYAIKQKKRILIIYPNKTELIKESTYDTSR